MFYLPFSREAKRRKEIKATLNAARVFVLSHEDLAEYREGRFAVQFAALDAAWRGKDALGVIRDVEAPTYDDAVYAQIEEVSEKKKYHNFEELLMTNDTWEVK